MNSLEVALLAFFLVCASSSLLAYFLAWWFYGRTHPALQPSVELAPIEVQVLSVTEIEVSPLTPWDASYHSNWGNQQHLNNDPWPVNGDTNGWGVPNNQTGWPVNGWDIDEDQWNDDNTANGWGVPETPQTNPYHPRPRSPSPAPPRCRRRRH